MGRGEGGGALLCTCAPAVDGAGGGAPGIHRRLAPFAPFARFLERKCYQTAVNESQKCIFFLCRALPRTPSQAELDMSAIFTPLMSGQTPELGLSADPGPRRPRSGKKRDLTRSTAKGRLLVPRSPLTKTTRQVGLRPVLAVCAPRAQSVRLGANPHREPLLPQRATSRRIT